jgi:hypothetical protein
VLLDDLLFDEVVGVLYEEPAFDRDVVDTLPVFPEDEDEVELVEVRELEELSLYTCRLPLLGLLYTWVVELGF